MTVSNQKAQFNEAAFLVFSYPPVPVSPNGSPLSLPSSSTSFYSSALCVLAFVLICPFHICSLLFHLWRLTFRSNPSSLDCSTRIQYLCVPISPRWIIALRTAQPMQVQIMSLPREHCCLSRARPSKVSISVAAITDEHGQDMSSRGKLQLLTSHLALASALL